MQFKNTTIMNTPSKDQLIQDLKKSFQEAIDWINAQPEPRFNQELIPGKWTIAGHLYHLIKSTRAVNQGMLLPKLGLRTMFGKNNRPERTFQETLDKYRIAVKDIVAPSKYAAEAGRTFERAALITQFEKELQDMIKGLGKWKEADMSVYVMPHPAIGKCTIREFIYFTTFHTNLHLKTLKEKYAVA